MSQFLSWNSDSEPALIPAILDFFVSTFFGFLFYTHISRELSQKFFFTIFTADDKAPLFTNAPAESPTLRVFPGREIFLPAGNGTDF